MRDGKPISANGKSHKASTTMVAWAKELHGQIKEKIKHINSELAALSKMVWEMHHKQGHRFIPKPGSRKGYTSFREYVASLGISGAKGSRLVAIGGLRDGPHALLPEEVERMPESNAFRLAKIPPEHRTKKVVQAAQETEPKKLPEKLKALGVPMTEEPRGVFVRNWPLLLIERAEEVEREGAYLEGVRDGDRSWSLSQKAMLAAFTFFLEVHREEIEMAKADAARRVAAEAPDEAESEEAVDGEILEQEQELEEVEDLPDIEEFEEEPAEAGD
jgi:hypothetical protein